MVRVFLALIGASAAWAQVTGVSPAVIITETTQGRQRDGSFQNLENRAPLSQSIAVTATGAWTATVSGPATTQGDFGGSMLSISPASGSGNGTILVTFGGCFTQPAGKYSAKITIATQVVPVLIQITPRTDLTRFLTSPAGCSNSSQRFPYNDNCPLPTAGASALTSAGTSYTSTTHGSRWTRMTATGNTTIYSARLWEPTYPVAVSLS